MLDLSIVMALLIWAFSHCVQCVWPGSKQPSSL
jgi:hypothetical protein